jgi:hypothetical protein
METRRGGAEGSRRGSAHARRLCNACDSLLQGACHIPQMAGTDLSGRWWRTVYVCVARAPARLVVGRCGRDFARWRRFATPVAKLRQVRRGYGGGTAGRAGQPVGARIEAPGLASHGPHAGPQTGPRSSRGHQPSLRLDLRAAQSRHRSGRSPRTGSRHGPPRRPALGTPRETSRCGHLCGRSSAPRRWRRPPRGVAGRRSRNR